MMLVVQAYAIWILSKLQLIGVLAFLGSPEVKDQNTIKSYWKNIDKKDSEDM